MTTSGSKSEVFVVQSVLFCKSNHISDVRVCSEYGVT